MITLNPTPRWWLADLPSDHPIHSPIQRTLKLCDPEIASPLARAYRSAIADGATGLPLKVLDERQSTLEGEILRARDLAAAEGYALGVAAVRAAIHDRDGQVPA